MIKIKKEKFIAILICTALAAAAVVILAETGLDWITGNVRVKRETYEEMAELKNRYQKLYELQDRIDSAGLYKSSDTKQMNAAYEAVVNSLNDPYAAYMTKEETERWDNAVNLTFYGIGVALNENQKGQTVIQKVYARTPAAAAGLKEGDRLRKVNGKSYGSAEAFRGALRSRKKDSVRLTYTRHGKTKTVKMLRTEIDDDAVSSGILKGTDIGYISITMFTKQSADDFKDALEQLTVQGAKSFVLDLRGNGGGYMDQAVNIADQLLPEGTITVTKNAAGKKKYYNSDENCTKLPYVVLVNGDTASASEILTSAIQDNGGGKIVGTKTYGKGVVQSEYHFGDGSALKLTTMEYFSPDGHRINRKGIRPDITVKQPAGGRDAQLAEAKKLLG